MKAVSVRRQVSMLILLFVAGAAGCASSPDIVTREKAPGQKYSAAEVREILLDHPFLLSGDYFRERQDLKPFVLSDVLAGSGKESTQAVKESQEAQEKRLAKLEAAVFEGRRAQPLSGDVLRWKVGFLMDTQGVPSYLADRLLSQADRLSVTYDVLFVHHRDLEQVLSQTDCLQRHDLGCIVRITAVYPGARFIALVESLTVPSTYPGTAQARFGVVDAGIGYRFPLQQMEMPLKEEADVNTFLELVVRRSYEQALDHKGLMPWTTHVFSDQNGEYFVSAGHRSGLMVGDLLEVIQEGRVVNSPTGTPAAWIPGKAKGQLRVERLFGEDLAVCRLISGQPPTMDDWLIPTRVAR
ncbi:MAG: hypothetical protein ACUVSA_03045 [Desulfosoma sp.]|uniref:hypothetical protein n=1 Tax=Desulfosoma sp. TaxID=2603217 RepID=UPI00404A0495